MHSERGKDSAEMQKRMLGGKIPPTCYSMKRVSLTAFFLSLVVHGCGLFISIVTFIKQQHKPPPHHKNQKLHTTKPTTKTAATSELKSSEFFPVYYFAEQKRENKNL